MTHWVRYVIVPLIDETDSSHNGREKMVNSTVKISDVHVVHNFENMNVDAILCQVTNTENGESVQMLEWLNGNKLEYTDSHLSINGHELLKGIGIYASLCDETMDEIRIAFEDYLENIN